MAFLPTPDPKKASIADLEKQDSSTIRDYGPEAQKYFDVISRQKTGRLFTSGGSTITPEGVNINPGVLGLRARGVGMAGEQLQNIRTDRANILGQGREQFIEGRTSGLRESLAEQEQKLTERLGKTGVTGEFGKQTQENFQASGQQKLEQGQQLALDEFTALSNQMDKTEGGMLKLMENIDFSAFTQDLQARGMAQDLKNQLTRLEQGRIGVDQQQKAADRAEAGNWLSLFASLF